MRRSISVAMEFKHSACLVAGRDRAKEDSSVADHPGRSRIPCHPECIISFDHTFPKALMEDFYLPSFAWQEPSELPERQA